jgi:hypothetical protein
MARLAKWNSADWVYPSDNPYGIPSLRPQSRDGLDLPLTAWGSVGRSLRMPGTWHFYVDDYRFESIFSAPDKVFATSPRGAIEPNSSIFDQTPRAVALWLIYRKRWLARYWQEQGLRVWVDLNVPAGFQSDNLIGVPEGWSHYATRGYDKRVSELDVEWSHAAARCGGDPIFAIIGGGRKVAEWCAARPVIHVPYAAEKLCYSETNA